METVGRYEVIRPLGKGGMGQVFLARDPKLERSVAIKLLTHDDNPDARSLFESEAKALAALSHPNIVTIFEIAEVDGRQFIAMEYLPGRSLRELLRDKPARDVVISICVQVAQALAAAHEAGILHRDIKPENVVVGKGHAVKVVDFGIARRLDAQSLDPTTTRRSKPTQDVKARAAAIVDVFTRTLEVSAAATAVETIEGSANAASTQSAGGLASATRTVFGTPAYMAPEVLMGSPSSTAGDVYSLGVMLYECLAGRRPYEAPNLHEVIARVIDGEEAPIRLDDPLADLIARMIDRDPAKRPSLSEIGKALARKRSTITAPPRRSRMILLAAMLVLAVTGLVVWRARTRPVATPIAPAPTPGEDRGPTAVLDVTADIPSYGTAPGPQSFGITLALLLESANVAVVASDTMRARGEPSSEAEWFAAASDHKAKLITRTALVERDGKVFAHVEVIDIATKKRIDDKGLDGDPDRIAELLFDVAAWIAKISRPGTQLSRTRNPKLASKLLDLGRKEHREHHASDARAYFEQAVLADSDSVEAWDRYANALRLSAGKPQLSDAAAEKAYKLALDGPRKKILHALLLNGRSQFPAALAEIAPLENAALADRDQIDVLYLIGEGHWHEGRHDLGFDYFKRVLARDNTYNEAASHAGEYALARRNEALGREYVALQRTAIEHIDFAMGKYEEVAKTGRWPFNAWADRVLGRPIRDSPTPLTRQEQTYKRLTDAAIANDLVAVEKEVATAVSELEPFTAYVATLLIHMAEVVIAADMKAPAEKLLTVLRTRRPGYNYRRLSILASPMLGAPKFQRAELTERLAHLAEALDAELAGNREKAAEILDRLVKNPTYEWDFVERVALRRNLRALGRTKEVEALCADSLRPAVMRPVFGIVQRICKS